MMKSVLVLESEQQELEEREFSFLSPDYNARMRKQQILEVILVCVESLISITCVFSRICFIYYHTCGKRCCF